MAYFNGSPIFASLYLESRIGKEEIVMNLPLTPQQLQALDKTADALPRLVDPRSNITYVLVSESEYATLSDIAKDDAEQRAIRAVALQNAVGRLEELP
jgi:hypothetical protein